MTPLSCPSRAFQEVFARRSTGGYYTRAEFPFHPHRADHKSISGKPSCLLVPAFRLFYVDSTQPGKFEEIFSFPKDSRSERLSVGKEEMTLYFDSMPDHRAVQNSDLHELLDQYSRENMSSDPRNLARIAHRYTATMADSQVRCLLEMMARILDERNNESMKATPLDAEPLSVVK